MCLLAICNTKPMPKEYFYESFRINHDGFGMAWKEGNKVAYMKGFMKVGEAWDGYKDFLKAKIFPHVVHFRLGSPTLDLLTHPFEITKDSELQLKNITDSNLLFHNGIVTAWKDRMWEMFTLRQSIPEGKLIDTRVIAILSSFYGNNIFNYLDGRWVVFGPDTLEKFGDFIEDDGISYSNSSYKPSTYTYGNYNSKNYTTTQHSSITPVSFSKVIIDEFII